MEVQGDSGVGWGVDNLLVEKLGRDIVQLGVRFEARIHLRAMHSNLACTFVLVIAF